MKFLLESVKHLVEPNLVPKFLKEILKVLVEIKGEEKVEEMMTRSDVTIQQLLPADKVADFITSTVKIIKILKISFSRVVGSDKFFIHPILTKF